MKFVSCLPGAYTRLIVSFSLLILSTFQCFAQDDFYNSGRIREVRMYFKEVNWEHILDSLLLTGETEGRLLGNVSIEGHLYKNAGIRYKGFSSANVNYKKNPFNIELDYAIANQNYQGFTKLKLSNVIHDPSFVREVLSYEIARKYMPAGRANFARVFVNDTLIGLYTNVESVDKAFIARHFTTNDGSFFKGSPAQLQYPFGQNANLANTHGTDSSGYMPYYKIESGYGWKDLYKLINTLNTNTDSIEQIVNVDRALWMHAFNYTLLNLDSYIGYAQNYYLYRDANGQFNTIPWDFNMSFGSFRKSDGSDHFTGLTIAEAKVLDPLQHLSFSISPRPLMTELFRNDNYKRKYLAHLRTILLENIVSGNYLERAMELQQLIDTAVLEDPNKFESYTDFLTNLTTTTAAGTANECPGLQELMEDRLAYLNTYHATVNVPVISDISYNPTQPAKGEICWISLKATNSDSVELHYRNNSSGIFHKIYLYDDGNHHDGIAQDGYFGGGILITGQTLQYYLYAENDSAGVFAPERAAYEFFTIQPQLSKGALVINEFMAANLNTTKNPEGNYTDWIELFNTTKEDIHLQGLYLSDKKENMKAWAFPDSVIPAKSYKILWADNASTVGISFNFSLAESGGQVLLSDAKDNLLDAVFYDKQIQGKSLGRSPNGTGAFAYMNPSFSRYNDFVSAHDENFSLFPNPARTSIFCEIKNYPDTYVLEVFNAIGQVVHSEKFQGGIKDSPYILKQINLSSFQAGSYLLKITQNGSTLSRKFVIH